MRVLMLAAGCGTRLRPITENIPKCLVPIGGKPLLQIWLERLSEAGFGPFLINTHYLHERVVEFVRESPFSNQISLVYEPELLGTAGTLINNIDFFQGKDGMVLHADNYCLADMKAFRNAHESRPKGCMMTMMTFRTNKPETCGIVELDKRLIVVGYYEKIFEQHGNLANGAVYILASEMMSEIDAPGVVPVDISVDVIPHYMGSILSWETSSTFLDIGTTDNYVSANEIY
jgi:mannose-1-phosphate guanylyltransferase